MLNGIAISSLSRRRVAVEPCSVSADQIKILLTVCSGLDYGKAKAS